MNRDLRIGLSLSLLALGAAGAFCFRADPAAVDPAVTLLDSDAAADGSGPAEGEAPLPTIPPPAPVRLGPPPTPVVAVASSGPPPLPVPAIGAPPAPAAVAPAVVLTPPALPPQSLDDAEPFAPAPADPRSDTVSYTVAPGDTLSGIAERELGSHRQYHTIYEANRDVLEHPDALRVGMTLRIPGRTTL